MSARRMIVIGAGRGKKQTIKHIARAAHQFSSHDTCSSPITNVGYPPTSHCLVLSTHSRAAFDGSWCYSDHSALPALHILYYTAASLYDGQAPRPQGTWRRPPDLSPSAAACVTPHLGPRPGLGFPLPLAQHRTCSASPPGWLASALGCCCPAGSLPWFVLLWEASSGPSGCFRAGASRHIVYIC